MKRYVVGLITDGKNFLLIKKERPEWQKGTYNGIGGKVEDGELDYEAMKRESIEECGIESDDWMLFSSHKQKDFSLSYWYLIITKEELLNFKSLTDEKVEMFSTIPDNIQPDIKALIKYLIQD